MYNHSTDRNGLTPSMRRKVRKQREKQSEMIKDALCSLECVSKEQKLSGYKKNPNLMIPSSGLMMMREKSTMDVI